MRHKGPATIALPLRDLHDLFTAPDVNPATDWTGADAVVDSMDENDDELYESGIDYLVSRLRGRPLARRGKLALELPPDQAQPAIADAARRAVERYSRHKILENKRALNELLWSGLKALQVGVLFLASCLILAAAIATSNVAAGSVGDIVTQGLTIIGWVSLWWPVEVLLYEWWPLWRDIRVYEYIQRMDVIIRPRR
jgi:hypothetical protein